MNFLTIVMLIGISAWTPYSFLVTIGAIISPFYRTKKGEKKATNVEFVIITIASRKVKNSLTETLRMIERYYLEGYKIWVVIEEKAELSDELSKMKWINLVKVPNEYKKNLKGKGRALAYFTRFYSTPDKWYAFLDDDNVILNDDFLYEIPIYEKKGYQIANPILVPRKGKNGITYILDHLRLFDDLTISRLFTGVVGKPLFNFHGELLLAKGSLLQQLVEVVDKTIAEDFALALKSLTSNVRSWQSRTRVSIKSPNSIRDLIGQRGRWYKGIVQNFSQLSSIFSLITALAILTWKIGMILGIVLFPLMIIERNPLLLTILPGIIYTWSAYLYGSLRYERPVFILGILFYPILESVAVFGMMVTNKFYVIDKT
ncbi:egghead [Sulfolobales archaeon HS-7]|nr:egghead [Sulfolobales archaeon HS-7]